FDEQQVVIDEKCVAKKAIEGDIQVSPPVTRLKLQARMGIQLARRCKVQAVWIGISPRIIIEGNPDQARGKSLALQDLVQQCMLGRAPPRTQLHRLLNGQVRD